MTTPTPPSSRGLRELLVSRTADSAARNSGNTGSTLTNDDTLLFPVSGNSTDLWLVQAFLVVSAANTAMDFKCAWSVPAGVTGYHGPGNGASNQGGWNSVSAGTTSALLTTNLAAAYSYGSFNGIFGVIHIALFFVGSTAGTIVYQWAQNTADASDLVLKNGSLLRATQIR